MVETYRQRGFLSHNGECVYLRSSQETMEGKSSKHVYIMHTSGFFPHVLLTHNKFYYDTAMHIHTYVFLSYLFQSASCPPPISDNPVFLENSLSFHFHVLWSSSGFLVDLFLPPSMEVYYSISEIKTPPNSPSNLLSSLLTVS